MPHSFSSRLVPVLVLAALLLFSLSTAQKLQADKPEAENPAPRQSTFSGKVLSTSGQQVVLQLRSRNSELNNTQRTVLLTEETRIRVDGEAASATDIRADMNAQVRRYRVEDEKWTALNVHFTTEAYRRAQAEAREKAREEREKPDASKDTSKSKGK